MMTKYVDVKTGLVTTEGDELYYEVRGYGQQEWSAVLRSTLHKAIG